MSNILIRHSERSVFRKVTCDCKQPNDCDNELCSMHSATYLIGKMPPNYPVPAIPTKVEYIFQGWAIDGVFVRVDDYAVAGAYKDGMHFDTLCIPYDFDYPNQD